MCQPSTPRRGPSAYLYPSNRSPSSHIARANSSVCSSVTLASTLARVPAYQGCLLCRGAVVATDSVSVNADHDNGRAAVSYQVSAKWYTGPEARKLACHTLQIVNRAGVLWGPGLFLQASTPVLKKPGVITCLRRNVSEPPRVVKGERHGQIVEGNSGWISWIPTSTSRANGKRTWHERQAKREIGTAHESPVRLTVKRARHH